MFLRKNIYNCGPSGEWLGKSGGMVMQGQQHTYGDVKRPQFYWLQLERLGLTSGGGSDIRRTACLPMRTLSLSLPAEGNTLRMVNQTGCTRAHSITLSPCLLAAWWVWQPLSWHANHRPPFPRSLKMTAADQEYWAHSSNFPQNWIQASAKTILNCDDHKTDPNYVKQKTQLLMSQNLGVEGERNSQSRVNPVSHRRPFLCRAGRFKNTRYMTYLGTMVMVWTTSLKSMGIKIY